MKKLPDLDLFKKHYGNTPFVKLVNGVLVFDESCNCASCYSPHIPGSHNKWPPLVRVRSELAEGSSLERVAIARTAEFNLCDQHYHERLRKAGPMNEHITVKVLKKIGRS